MSLVISPRFKFPIQGVNDLRLGRSLSSPTFGPSGPFFFAGHLLLC